MALDPVTESSAVALLSQLDQFATDDLETFLGAVGAVLQQTDQVMSGDVMWGNLVDIDAIPDEGLPWLGQLVGVEVNVDYTPAQQRQQIRNHESWNRGTVLSLKNSIKRILTGTQTVDIVERDTGAYHFSVTTYSAETPPDTSYADTYAGYATYNALYTAYTSYLTWWLADPRNLIQLLISINKPAGLQFTYSIVNGSPGTVVEYLTLFNHYSTLEQTYDDFQTYDDLRTTAY